MAIFLFNALSSNVKTGLFIAKYSNTSEKVQKNSYEKQKGESQTALSPHFSSAESQHQINCDGF